LQTIQQFATANEAENERFAALVKTLDGDKVDQLVHSLNEKIAPQIDCTACGNCCKSLMINVTNEEADRLSTYFNQSRKNFDEQYLEKSGTTMLMNTIPCTFLNNNRCNVYEHRFAGCREFPAMHLPHFTKRLFSTFMHYARCPIIFNIVENLKEELGVRDKA
jgi:Fe-S-cluster containining protein